MPSVGDAAVWELAGLSELNSAKVNKTQDDYETTTQHDAANFFKMSNIPAAFIILKR